jgi:hypothetical protein
MAQVSISKALMLVLVIVVSSAAAMVSAQDSELASAPAPTMVSGADAFVPVFGAILGSSLLLSVFFWTEAFGCTELNVILMKSYYIIYILCGFCEWSEI